MKHKRDISMGTEIPQDKWIIKAGLREGNTPHECMKPALHFSNTGVLATNTVGDVWQCRCGKQYRIMRIEARKRFICKKTCYEWEELEELFYK